MENCTQYGGVGCGTNASANATVADGVDQSLSILTVFVNTSAAIADGAVEASSMASDEYLQGLVHTVQQLGASLALLPDVASAAEMYVSIHPCLLSTLPLLVSIFLDCHFTRPDLVLEFL